MDSYSDLVRIADMCRYRILRSQHLMDYHIALRQGCPKGGTVACDCDDYDYGCYNSLNCSRNNLAVRSGLFDNWGEIYDN